MSDREIISALKYVSRMKPEFRLSELGNYAEGEKNAGEIYAVVEPLLYDLDLKATPEGKDFIVRRLPKAQTIVPNQAEKERMETFFAASHVPRKLERLIEGYVERKACKRWDDPAVLERIRQAIVAQKAQYWKEGQARKIDYSTGYSVLGYLSYQFPVYFMQFEHVLADLVADGLLKDRLKVLDVGTGPGVVPLAIADFFGRLDEASAEIFAIEKFDENSEAYAAIVPEYAALRGKVNARKPIRADILDKPAIPDRIDLMVFSNVLNEVRAPLDKKVAAVQAMAEHLAPDGNLIIIEPADKENSTRMRRLVHRLTEKGLGIYSPCSFVWCTRCKPEECWSFEVKQDIKPPALMKKLADTAEPYRYLNTDIKFSYAILRKDGLTRCRYKVPPRAKFARLSLIGRHVEKRVNAVAAVMSGDLGDQKNHLYKICDGTPQKPVYAALAAYNVTPDNEVLTKSNYGDVLAFENVLVRYNKENDAYNLLVSKATHVGKAGEREEDGH